MKNCIVVLLVVIVLVLSSFLYKRNRLSYYQYFPMHEIKDEENRATLYLFLFFSKQNCKPCLEVIETLNRLPNEFKIIGIVPDRELTDEAKLREITGIRFELRGAKKYKKFIPPYAPTLFGVSKNKTILFVLPGIPHEKEYLKQFLIIIQNIWIFLIYTILR